MHGANFVCHLAIMAQEISSDLDSVNDLADLAEDESMLNQSLSIKPDMRSGQLNDSVG